MMFKKRAQLLNFIILLAVLVIGIERLAYIGQVARRPSHSFVSYYTASVLLARGEDVNRFYDGHWFKQQVATFTPTVEEYYQPNPPTTALVLLPLAHLDYGDARTVLTLLTLVAVMFTVGFILYAESFDRLTGSIALLVVVLYQPLFANFKYGQFYGMLFVALTAIWYSLKYQRHRIAGGLLGTILIMKTAGYLLFPLLIMGRKWRALVWSIGTVGIIGLSTLPIMGVDSWLTFLRIFPEYSQRPSIAVTAYQTIPGFFKRQFAFHEYWNPSPVLDFPLLATGLSLAILGGMLILTLWKGRGQKQSLLVFCSLVFLTVLTSPVSLDYHYTITLLPVLLLLAMVKGMTRWQIGWLIVGIFLLAVDYPYQKPPYPQSFLSLMAYPKLFGGVLLWGLCVRLMGDNRA